MHTDTLFLCSSSKIRQKLLRDAQIPFSSIAHHACEESVEFKGSFEEYVVEIAIRKLESIIPQDIHQNPDRLFLLAADTMVHGLLSKKLYGKPKDHTDAINIITAISKEPLQVTTGCALAYFEKKETAYQQIETVTWHTGATIRFTIPTDEIATYLNKNPQALHAAGATTIEEYGSRYVSSIHGSYTAVLGLPIFELTQYIKQMGFVYE